MRELREETGANGAPAVPAAVSRQNALSPAAAAHAAPPTTRALPSARILSPAHTLPPTLSPAQLGVVATRSRASVHAGYSGRALDVTPICVSDPGMTNANMRYVVLEVGSWAGGQASVLAHVSTQGRECATCPAVTRGARGCSLCQRPGARGAPGRLLHPLRGTPFLPPAARPLVLSHGHDGHVLPESADLDSWGAAPACLQVDGDAPENQDVRQQLEVGFLLRFSLGACYTPAAKHSRRGRHKTSKQRRGSSTRAALCMGAAQRMRRPAGVLDRCQGWSAAGQPDVRVQGAPGPRSGTHSQARAFSLAAPRWRAAPSPTHIPPPSPGSGFTLCPLSSCQQESYHAVSRQHLGPSLRCSTSRTAWQPGRAGPQGLPNPAGAVDPHAHTHPSFRSFQDGEFIQVELVPWSSLLQHIYVSAQGPAPVGRADGACWRCRTLWVLRTPRPGQAGRQSGGLRARCGRRGPHTAIHAGSNSGAFGCPAPARLGLGCPASPASPAYAWLARPACTAAAVLQVQIVQHKRRLRLLPAQASTHAIAV